MRKEADDTGLLAELEYWKQRTGKFSCLVDQIKSQPQKGVLTTLVAAKSKIIKVRGIGSDLSVFVDSCAILLFSSSTTQTWRELDGRITDASNEAKDNLKYMYTLERLCKPVYHSDPVGMLEDIPSLTYTIQMIHAVSRYYNTSERMTSLFVKVRLLLGTRLLQVGLMQHHVLSRDCGTC